MEESQGGFIALLDGEGNELPFEILDVIPYEGRSFAVLLPADDPNGDGGNDEVTILEVLGGDTPEEEYLEGIEDEALLETIFGLFNRRLEENED
jgi:uncharacterized protein YrzB (UPF0473 family)